MKFLVTGSAGLVGKQVVDDLVKEDDQVYSVYHKSKPLNGIPTQMDLNSVEKIKDIVDKKKPDVIIHLAALTNVDLCETEKVLAMKINCEATGVLSKQAAKQKAFFIYVSTDYVFDGEKGLYKETDPTNPINFYGKTKLEGEKLVMDLASSWCIARTSTPYGVHPTKNSFPLWVADNLKNQNEINVVIDQFISPTYLPNLSRMLIEIAKRQIVGTIHLAGATRISRYEEAELVAEKFNLNKNLLKPANMDEINWKAKRPKDSSLDVSNAFSILKEKPIKFEQGLENLLSQMKSQPDK